MEYTADELTSMASCICAAYHGISYRVAKDIVKSGIGEAGALWPAVADAAFTHLDYIKHNRNMAMMDAEMGLG